MLFWRLGIEIEAKTLGIYSLVGYSCCFILKQGFSSNTVRCYLIESMANDYSFGK
jgi:hypothetical protein